MRKELEQKQKKKERRNQDFSSGIKRLFCSPIRGHGMQAGSWLCASGSECCVMGNHKPPKLCGTVEGMYAVAVQIANRHSCQCGEPNASSRQLLSHQAHLQPTVIILGPCSSCRKTKVLQQLNLHCPIASLCNRGREIDDRGFPSLRALIEDQGRHEAKPTPEWVPIWFQVPKLNREAFGGQLQTASASLFHLCFRSSWTYQIRSDPMLSHGFLLRPATL
ncbi:hypothetical protein VTI74DRAFT_10400 [Chaetomium olivicolor]